MAMGVRQALKNIDKSSESAENFRSLRKSAGSNLGFVYNHVYIYAARHLQL